MHERTMTQNLAGGWMNTVKAADFDLGAGLTAAVEQRISQVISSLKDLL